jgi:Tfp pilus assembly protein PilN
MNAVNLIPADSRKRRGTPTTSKPTMALIAGLLVVLIAGVLYVLAANKVTTRKTELARVTANVASWRAVAASYDKYVKAAQQHNQELADVRQLASARFPWEHLLSQIGGLMPSQAALSTLQATTSATSSATQPPVPAVQLNGCATSQTMVAQTMVQLHRVQGVTAVTLTSTSSSNAGSAASSGGGANASGGCPFNVQFQMALTFGGSTAGASPYPSTTAASSSGTPATSSGSTPTAAAATNSTGAQSQ